MAKPSWRDPLIILLGSGFLSVATGCHAPGFARGVHQDPRRAGFPDEVSAHAKPSDTGRYYGYQGGGGSWFRRRGDAPTPEEGTWGWDYGGLRFSSFNALTWWHGRRYQGGEGAYRIDNPGLAERLIQKREQKEVEGE